MYCRYLPTNIKLYLIGKEYKKKKYFDKMIGICLPCRAQFHRTLFISYLPVSEKWVFDQNSLITNYIVKIPLFSV